MWLLMAFVGLMPVATGLRSTGEDNQHKRRLTGEDDSRLTAFHEAIDNTVSLASGASAASSSPMCVQSLQDLMIRGHVPMTAEELRYNLTDAQLLRLALLASIAMISPWDQDPDTGHFMISETDGILVEAFHPSTSESDIMLCVVCTLLAVIVMFHVTTAQKQFVQASDAGAQQPMQSQASMLSTALKGH